jgi:integrase
VSLVVVLDDVVTDSSELAWAISSSVPPPGCRNRALAPGLAAAGIPLDEFRPGDPLFETAQEALEFKQAARSPATKRAYASDFRLFAAWCGQAGLGALPATISTIGLYMTELSTGAAKVSTISRKLTAISFRHKEEKLPSPCSMKADRELAQVYSGIRKTRGIKQAGKAPVSLSLIKRMVDTVEGTLTAARDRALVLIGFAGGLRRSEVAGICLEHLAWHSSGSGITITLPKSKTDQERQGREVEIARGSQPENTPASDCTCPIRALEQWLRQANITSGPVFRKVSRGENVQKTALNPASVAWILKRALGRAGVRDLDRYGAHSLRAGFATTAFDNGVPEFKIRQQTGHKTSRMLEKYIRSEQKARQEAASSLGL